MNTKTTALRANYHKLADLERFRLVTAAAERGDKGELLALNRSAPKKRYEMMGFPYAGMLQGIHVVAWACVTDVLRCGVYLMAAWFQETANGLPTAEETQESDDDGFNWWAVGLEYARSALGAWEGLGLFADHLGVTVDQALEYAPATDDAKLVIGQAETFLALDDDFRRWIAHTILGIEPDAVEASLAEGTARIQERRDAAAREACDLYVKIWDKEVGE